MCVCTRAHLLLYERLHAVRARAAVRVHHQLHGARAVQRVSAAEGDDDLCIAGEILHAQAAVSVERRGRGDGRVKHHAAR